jgi:hypothetical protein
MNWLTSVSLWAAKTFTPAPISATVTVDEAAIKKALPDIIAAEPQIKQAIADLQVAMPNILAAATVLWPAFKQTLAMIDAHIAQGQPASTAVAHAQRKIAAVTKQPTDAVERWTKKA